MIGILQIMTYLLCVYLVFKGVEIFQIALMSSEEKKGMGLAIGGIMIIVSLVCAVGFSYWVDVQAESISGAISGVNSLLSPTKSDSKKMVESDYNFAKIIPSSSISGQISNIECRLIASPPEIQHCEYAWKFTANHKQGLFTIPITFYLQFLDDNDFYIFESNTVSTSPGVDSFEEYSGTITIPAYKAKLINSMVVKT